MDVIFPWSLGKTMGEILTTSWKSLASRHYWINTLSSRDLPNAFSRCDQRVGKVLLLLRNKLFQDAGRISPIVFPRLQGKTTARSRPYLKLPRGRNNDDFVLNSLDLIIGTTGAFYLKSYRNHIFKRGTTLMLTRF